MYDLQSWVQIPQLMFEKTANDSLGLFGESSNSKEIEFSQAHMGVMISSFKLV